MIRATPNELRKLRQRLRQRRVRIAELMQERLELEHRLRSRRSEKTPNVPNVQRLLQAAVDGDVRIVRHELASGTDPDVRDNDGKTPLLNAVYAPRNISVVRALIGAGADVDARDYQQNTPLIACSDDDRLAYVKALVEAGADVNVRNVDGDTPLTNAACWGAFKVVRYLLTHGAQPLLTDGVGMTPRELARQQRHAEIDRLLAKYVDRIHI